MEPYQPRVNHKARPEVRMHAGRRGAEAATEVGLSLTKGDGIYFSNNIFIDFLYSGVTKRAMYIPDGTSRPVAVLPFHIT